MRIKTTTTPAPTATTTTATEPSNPGGLPPECLDPTNRLYVPEELREHYVHDPVEGMLALRSDPHAARYLARRVYRERLAADPDEWASVVDREMKRLGHLPPRHAREVLAKLKPESYQPDIAQGDALERALTTADWTYGAHLRALEAATARHIRAQKNQATRATVRASRTCAICGELDPQTQPFAIGRVGLKPVSQSGEFQACPPCARALQAALQERAAAEQVDGRTRGELAAQWIAKGGQDA